MSTIIFIITCIIKFRDSCHLFVYTDIIYNKL